MAEIITDGTMAGAMSAFKAMDPALPIVLPIGGGNTAVNTGLSKRELFAAMAMQGLIGNGYIGSPARAAINAVDYADALIAALKEDPQA